MTSKRIKILLLLVGLAVLCAVPLFINDPTILHIFIYTFFFAYFAAAWNVVGSYAGQPSLGHAIFFGIGGYTSTILFINYGITPWLGMFVGAILAALAALALGFPTFRVRGPFFAFITLAFTLLISLLFIYFHEYTGGATGLPVPLKGDEPLLFQFNSKAPYYYTILAFFIVIMFVTYKVEKSKFGYYLLAIREDEDAAKAVGIHVFKYKMIAAALSAFLTAFLGTFYAQYTRFIDPHEAFGLWRTFQPMLISVLGGYGLWGPLVGAAILTPINESIIIIFGGRYATFGMMLYGLAVMLIMLFMPKGIVGILKRVYTHFRS
ncbi:MAG: branched-chain amino acid ABC transporter permease [Nitrososphaerales archaeon]